MQRRDMPTQKEIKEFLRHKARRPMGFKDICDRMKLSSPERRSLRRIIRQMVESGEIMRTRSGCYGLPEEMNLVNGYFEAHRDGFGFVIQEQPGERDIFIPARKTLGAMDNDRVVARIENVDKRDGRIVRIIERAHTKIAGIFESDRTGFYVRPKKRSAQFDLYIPHAERAGAKDGDLVIAEVVSYPTEMRPASGRIVKVLRRPVSPREDVEAIIEEMHLPKRFPHDALAEARSLRMESRPGSHRRKDLKKLTTFTIDGEHAKDFDDAVSIRKNSDGYTLWVHIADVGFFVKWNSTLDMEARERGTSVYFPDRVIPMLPKELSEELCSLKPSVERFAFSVEMDFDDRGRRKRAAFYPSVIISNERMTYTSVKKIVIDKDADERKKYEHILSDLDMMAELAGLIKVLRAKRGSLDFDLPEPEVLLDIQGNPEAIVAVERNFAHIMIEEFMISANEAVAEFIEEQAAPSLYRIHEEPDLSKMQEAAKMAKLFGISAGRSGMLPRDFSSMLSAGRRKKGFAGSVQEEILNHIILRSLKQARYSTINVGHFGLASKSYTHFTSPIRRYPDLVVHRVLRELLLHGALSDKRIAELTNMLPDIAFSSSRTERRAADAEMDVIAAMKAWFMKERVGEEFEGRVISVAQHGLKIRLKDFYVEGFLHVSYMTDDYYQYDEKGMALSGRHSKKSFSIGSSIDVRIDRVDIEEREIVLGMAGRL
ncbi:MAG: ribonuclease R [Nitrospiraceae bacterium]|nr:ribonuclease R [Nitrospiraceae bacterium]